VVELAKVARAASVAWRELALASADEPADPATDPRNLNIARYALAPRFCPAGRPPEGWLSDSLACAEGGGGGGGGGWGGGGGGGGGDSTIDV